MPNTPTAHHPRLRFTAAALLALVLAPSLYAQQPKPTPFTKQVESCFAAWDKNDNGALDATELDALVVDKTITGEAAAAVATLKAVQRSGKFDLPPLTLEYFHNYEQATAAGKKPEPSFDRAYSRGLRRIKTSKRDIFADDLPKLETCHQGPLGDCFFVSVVGASVARNPDEVHSMIKTAPDGSLDIAFPGAKPVHLAPLTDTELALTSTTGNDGLWLAVLEKAYGTVRNDSLPQAKQSESTTDAIARGGSTVSTIKLLTGHNVARVGFRPRSPQLNRGHDPHASHDTKPKDGEAAPSDTPRVDPAALQAHLDATLPKLRDQLADAMKNHRLAAAGTPKDGKMPPGVNPSHAYAILGYDRGTDVVHLWNPHGNTFAPKGEPGLEHGYPTKAGHFNMPLTEMGHVFSGVTIETSEPTKK